MGRHATPRARSGTAGRSALIAGLAVVLVAVLALSVTWWLTGDDDDAAEASCQEQTVRVTVAPEVGALVEEVLAEPAELSPGVCAVAEVTAEEPLQTLADLGSLDAESLPQVWVPDSSLWVARAGDAGLEATGSLASSPLVLATSRAAAEQLGWTQAPPSWGSALATDRPLAVPDLSAKI